MKTYIVKYDQTLKKTLEIMEFTESLWDSIWTNADLRMQTKRQKVALAWWDPDWLFVAIEAKNEEQAERYAKDYIE
jgi:hypothetical protein